MDYLPGVEYLFARITPDQLDLPDFVVKYDYEVRAIFVILFVQWRSDGAAGGAGRTGRHLLGAAKGRKTRKLKKKST